MPRAFKPPSQRQLRVGEELRHVIANLIERGGFRDPDLIGRAITVTEVRISPDLRNATVFVLPLGGGENEPILAGLKRAKAFLRRELARAVKLRMVPELWFQADLTFDEASHIDRLLRLPEVRRDIENPSPEISDGDMEEESGDGQ